MTSFIYNVVGPPFDLVNDDTIDLGDTFLGEYVDGTAYIAANNDTVSHLGLLYICIQDNATG